MRSVIFPSSTITARGFWAQSAPICPVNSSGIAGSITFADGPYEAAEGADALALITEWGAFRSPDLDKLKAALKAPIVFDGRNQYEPEKMREAGFTYDCIGRAAV